jgi:glycerophosphoryl diester phosphodiesterase
VKFPFGTTIAIAHRGAHDAQHPENSLAAIEHAIQLGAAAVEFDVWSLGGGRLVVAHDRPPMSETHKSLPSLQGGAGEGADAAPLAAVGPFLEAIARSSVLLNFDWKGPQDEDRVGPLLASYGLLDRTIVSADDPRPLRVMKQATPRLTTGLSWETALSPDQVAMLLREAHADALMLDYHVVSPAIATAVRAANAGLFLWTVTDTATFDSLRRFAPDGIATDAIAEQLRATR